VVARAESAGGSRQRAGIPGIRCDPPARCLGHPALPPQHPSPATLRDDQPRRAGEPAPPVHRSRLPLGAAAHPPAVADVQTRVPPLRRADGVLPDCAPARSAAGVRPTTAVETRARAGLGQPAQPSPAPAPGGRHAAPARHRAARGRRHTAAGRARRPHPGAGHHVGSARPAWPSCSSPRTYAARWAASTRS